MINLMIFFLPNFLKKSKLYCLLSALLAVFLLSFVFSAKSFAAPLGANDVNLHSWTQISSLDITSALGCQILNYDSTKRGGAGCVAYNQNGQLTLMEKSGGGAVAFTGNLIAALYQNPAASSGEYLAYLGKEMGVIKSAYAADQGTGFGGLTPILPIWAAIRNVTYIIFIILFLVTGLLIMFRMKINPQTVISVQNALPRIVITLILITFSYAIAGFLIDLMYVLMFIVSSIFNDLVPGAPSLLQELLGKNIFEVWGRMPLQGFSGLIEFGKTIADIVDAIVAGFPAVGGIAGGLAFLILGIALLWALFRLFFSLLKAYIFVLALTIFGPLMLLADALPGRSGGGLSGWVRGMAANLLVFPFVWTMFLFASALIKVGQVNQPAGAGWIAPFLGTGWGSQQFPSLLALGVILLTPQALKILEDAFKPPPFPYGAAIGQAIGAGAGVVGAPFSFMGRATSQGVSLALGQRVAQRIGLTPPGTLPPGAGGGGGGGH